MRQRFVSGLLFLVMLVMVGHHAIPHHHHPEVLIHHHDSDDPDQQDTNTGEDHHPVRCHLHNIQLDVPRGPFYSKHTTHADGTSLAGILPQSLPGLHSCEGIAIFNRFPEPPRLEGIKPSLPARGPPC